MATGYSEYAAGWEFVENERGITVTRVFHYDPNSAVDNGVDLPKVGDGLDATLYNAYLMSATAYELNKIICRTRTWRALAGDANVIQWTLTYSNEITDDNLYVDMTAGGVTQASDPSQLPITMEYAGEYLTINPQLDKASDYWKWKSDSTTVIQPIPKRVNSSTLRIVRYVTDAYYATFQCNVRYCSGRVNNTANPFNFGTSNYGRSAGGGKGCWLFTGSTTEIFRNVNNTKYWRCELEFLYRDPDGKDEEGWQKILRLDGQFDEPQYGSSPKKGLYEYAEFSALFDDRSSPVV